MNSWCEDLELLIKSRTSLFWIRSLEEERFENILNFTFKKLNIKYIPTVILFYNGEEVYRVESGISLKLPDNAIQRIEEEIEKNSDGTFKGKGGNVEAAKFFNVKSI